jgi:transcriptional regulator with XRE-family HTH domain
MSEARRLGKLGDAIRLIREERDMTADALAVNASVEPERLAEIEAGEVDPGYELTLRLAEALKTPASAIIERAEELAHAGYDESLVKPNGNQPEKVKDRPVTVRWRTRQSSTPDSRYIEARLTFTFAGRALRFLASWLFPPPKD